MTNKQIKEFCDAYIYQNLINLLGTGVPLEHYKISDEDILKIRDYIEKKANKFYNKHAECNTLKKLVTSVTGVEFEEVIRDIDW